MDSLELKRLLGKGNSGDVYSGTLSGQPVAVKRLRNPRSDMGAAALLREAQTLAELPRHDNVVAYLAALEHKGELCLVMEQVDGVTLDKLLDHGRLSLNASIYIIRKILDGLACVHAAGIVHRDLSPSNILIAADGTVKIVDFGLSRTAGRSITAGAMHGTLAYLSPEQARGEPANVSSDLFSVGAIFYELLTRETPFKGTLAEVYSKLMTSTPAKTPSAVDPMIPYELVDIVNRLLAKDQTKRYGSAAQVSGELPREFAGRAELLIASKRVLLNGRSSSSEGHRPGRVLRSGLVLALVAAAFLAVGSFVFPQSSKRTPLTPAMTEKSSAIAVEGRKIDPKTAVMSMSATVTDNSDHAVEAQSQANQLESVPDVVEPKSVKKPAKRRSKRKKSPPTRHLKSSSSSEEKQSSLPVMTNEMAGRRRPHWYPVRIVESDEVPLPSHQ